MAMPTPFGRKAAMPTRLNPQGKTVPNPQARDPKATKAVTPVLTAPAPAPGATARPGVREGQLGRMSQGGKVPSQGGKVPSASAMAAAKRSERVTEATPKARVAGERAATQPPLTRMDKGGKMAFGKGNVTHSKGCKGGSCKGC